MVTVHIFIYGFVQGIGFRHFVRSNARRLDLTGWVRNVPSLDFGKQGCVEVLFQSNDKSKIEEMIMLCRKGPFLAEVKNIEIKQESSNTQDYKSFEII